MNEIQMALLQYLQQGHFCLCCWEGMCLRAALADDPALEGGIVGADLLEILQQDGVFLCLGTVVGIKLNIGGEESDVLDAFRLTGLFPAGGFLIGGVSHRVGGDGHQLTAVTREGGGNIDNAEGGGAVLFQLGGVLGGEGHDDVFGEDPSETLVPFGDLEVAQNVKVCGQGGGGTWRAAFTVSLVSIWQTSPVVR